MTDQRTRLIRVVHAKARAAGLDDDTRRAFQTAETGKASLADMTATEVRAVLTALDRKLGRGGRGALPEGPHTSKLRALWISGYWLGVVRSRDDAALAAWVCRVTGVEAARWATPAQTARCVEALKDWLARDAGVIWPARRPSAGAGEERARILEAQWRRLHGQGPDDAALEAWVEGVRRAPGYYATLPAPELDRLIRDLGRRLRSAIIETSMEKQ